MEGRMNQIYEQWKKTLASPQFLGLYAFIKCFIYYIIFSFVLNLVNKLLDVISYLSTYGVTGIAQVFQTLFNQYRTHFFSQFFLHSERPLIEGIVFLITFSIFGLRLVKKIYKKRISYKDINKGTKGTARWMQEKEAKRTYELVDITSPNLQLERGGFPVMMLADRKTLLVETDNTNLKVLGASQAARKTQLYYYWCLYLNTLAKNPDSLFVNDLKMDMLLKWRGNPRYNDFDTYALNFIAPKNSIHVNPFSLVWEYAKAGKMDEAEVELQALGKDLFMKQAKNDLDFVKGASETFTSILLVLLDFAMKYNRPEWFTYAGLYDLQLSFNRPEGEEQIQPLDLYMKTQDPSSLIAKHYMTATSATKKQVQSFYFLMSTTLSDFSLGSILEMTSSSDLNYREMVFPSKGQKPIVLFLSSPQGNDNIFEPLQSQITSQLFRLLTSSAQRAKGQKFVRRFRFLGDEINNSAYMSGLKSAANLGQQSGFLLALGMQSLAGFKDVYPEDEGKAILNGLPATAFLISEDDEDIESVQRKLGKSTVIGYNRIGSPMDEDKSITEMEEERALLDNIEIMHLAQDESLFFNLKKRTDRLGKDVIPNPIYAHKKRTNKQVNVPGEAWWKKALGFAKREEETTFEPYTNLIPAFDFLYKGKTIEFFDDQGLGLDDVDLRKNVKLDPYGEEQPFDRRRHIVPHEVVQLTFKLWFNKDNEEYDADEKANDERKLKELEEQIKSGAYYDNLKTEVAPLNQEIPQGLSKEFTEEPIEIPVVSTQSVKEKTEENEESFSANRTLREVLGETYPALFNYLTPEQGNWVKEKVQTLGELNDQVLISDKVSLENKANIENLLNQAYQRLNQKEEKHE